MSSFERYLQRLDNPGLLCLKYLLVWIALADGEVSKEERSLLERMFPNEPGHVGLAILEEWVRERTIDELAVACAVVRDGATAEGRRLSAQLAIDVAVADGRLSVSEIHRLHFLRDLIGFSADEFSALYHACTGSALPAPADLGSRAVWEQRESEARARRSRESGRSDSGQRRRTNGSAHGMSERTARALLGVEDTATAEEVRAAYRRLAQVHHPDRFQTLGEDAVTAATARFAQIQQAYDQLRRL